jgi:hypothetical protein
MSQFRQLRIIHPLAVDRSVVYTYSFRMRDAPQQMFRDTVAFANVVNGTASWVLTDDLEVYERIQRGFASGAVEWAYVGRGHGADVDEPGGTRRGASGTSEVFIRAQMGAWLDYMTQQNAALVEESSAAAASLKEQAQALSRTVTVFKLKPGGLPIALEPSYPSPALNRLTLAP